MTTTTPNNSMSSQPFAANKIIHAVQKWLETFVIGHNLCPFAKRELRHETIHFQVEPVTTATELLTCLTAELERLNTQPALATTLLIHPYALQNFGQYNQFLDNVDQLLEQLNLTGIYQIASFHPNYQFAGTQPNDAENYTNKAPYPILHILREASLERAIEQYPDVDQIPHRNIQLMNHLGSEALQCMFKSYFTDA